MYETAAPYWRYVGFLALPNTSHSFALPSYTVMPYHPQDNNDYDLAPAGLARADRIGVVRAGAGEGHGVQHLARDALRRLPESKLYLS